MLIIDLCFTLWHFKQITSSTISKNFRNCCNTHLRRQIIAKEFMFLNSLYRQNRVDENQNVKKPQQTTALTNLQKYSGPAETRSEFFFKFCFEFPRATVVTTKEPLLAQISAKIPHAGNFSRKTQNRFGIQSILTWTMRNRENKINYANIHTQIKSKIAKIGPNFAMKLLHENLHPIGDLIYKAITLFETHVNLTGSYTFCSSVWFSFNCDAQKAIFFVFSTKLDQTKLSHKTKWLPKPNQCSSKQEKQTKSHSHIKKITFKTETKAETKTKTKTRKQNEFNNNSKTICRFKSNQIKLKLKGKWKNSNKL